MSGDLDELEELLVWRGKTKSGSPKKLTKIKNQMIDGVLHRQCHYCLEFKPATLEFFHPVHKSIAPEIRPKFQTRCKICNNKRAREASR